MAFRYTAGEEPPPPLQYSHGQPQQLTPLPPPQSGLVFSAESTAGGNTELRPIVTAGHGNFRFGMSNDYLNHGVVHTSGYHGQGFGWVDNSFGPSNNVKEEIQRALEKERIREEIIAAEIARRRILEAEVRAELKLERELAMRVREGNAFGKVSYPMEAGLPSESRGFPFLQDAKGRSLEERIAMYAEESLRMRARCETQGFDVVPFQPSRTISPKVEEPAPSHSENGQQKEKIVFLTKPGADLSGMKRKAVSPVEVSAKQLFNVKNTKRNGVWSCDICEVSTTSERALNEHIQGKKHKSKEAALKEKKNCNIGLGVVPNKKLKPVIEVTHSVDMEQGVKIGEVASQIGQSEPSSLHDVSTKCLDANNVLILPENAKNKKLKKVKLQKAPKRKPKEKNNFLFWCDMCQVGAKNEKVMEDHRKGKKHTRLLEKAAEKGQAVLTPHTSQGEDNASEATEEENHAFDDVDRATKEETVKRCDLIVIEEAKDCEAAEVAIDTLNC
ncbi:OLC1v1035507C1 [Oldenlandia corymbosa var. corymbosa]|uniref:OLC1v1035507C1 n=1 Tax=Oldenlandia corymbosa var. corymbosa TaxID=529605 RepID=A0AAV1CT79_OLDCO|nr:OLC1v1035507C1 [Oldenlandia corymbosa var. corymbosa]